MFVGNSLSACAVAFTKLSIISSYLRVFPHQSLRVTMFITMAITIGLMLASIPVTVFQCDPVRAAWDFTITNGRVSGIESWIISLSLCRGFRAFDGNPKTLQLIILHQRIFLIDNFNSATISSTFSTLAQRSIPRPTLYCVPFPFGTYGLSRYLKSKRLLSLACSS